MSFMQPKHDPARPSGEDRPEQRGPHAALGTRWRPDGAGFAGLALLTLGAVVLAGWMLKVITLVQVMPVFAPMQANTAVCFLLCGIGLLRVKRDRSVTAVCGGLVGIIALATLAEYALGRNFGIDTLLVEPWTSTRTSHPGRMSPLTALCFTVASGTLLLGPAGRRGMVASVGGMVLCVVAVIVLFGYVARIEAALGWGQFTRVAAHTAAGFLVMGT